MQRTATVATPPAGVDPRPRTRRFKVAAVLVAVAAALLIPELLVRLFGPDLQAYEGMRFGGDANSLRLFVRDPELHWALRREAAVPFLGVPVRTDAHGFRIAEDPGPAQPGATVLCLGDSTTFGWAETAADAFAGRLAAELREQEPERRWVVHNAGVPGYSSFQLRLVAERWIPALRPQWVVICIGNNDAWPARRSDRAVHESRAWSRPIVAALEHSAFLTWAAAKLRGEGRAENPVYFADDAVPRVDLDDMDANLTAVVALARAHGGRALLLGPGVNVYCPPQNMNDSILRCRALGDLVDADIRRGDPAVAFARIDAATIAPRDRFYVDWLRAMVTALAVDGARGHDELERLFERHPYPDRAKRSYRGRQRTLAARLDVPFVDIDELFRSGRSQAEAQALYRDWCHPTAAGHRLITAQLLRWIGA